MKHSLPRRLSLRAKALNLLLTLSVKPVVFFGKSSPLTMKAFKLIYANACHVLQISKIPTHVRARAVRVAGCEAEWVTAEGCDPEASKVIYYLHGGGYFFSSAQLHRSVTWRLAHYAKRPVFAINYRDAPEHDLAHCLEDALAGYDHLLSKGYKPEDIIIGGDSAGGHLTLVTLQQIRETGRPMPAGGILISPLTDISCQSESLRHNNFTDTLFWGHAVRSLTQFLRRDKDPTDPLVSPVFGNFAELPPLMFIVSAAEVLRDDGRRAARQANAAGVPVCYEEWRAMPHVFPFFANWLPEGKRAYKHMASFIDAVEKQDVKGYVLSHSDTGFMQAPQLLPSKI